MLGPVRFSHFETCAREVCRTFRLKDDMESYVATLTSLDDILASLRAELAELLAKKEPPESSSADGAPDSTPSQSPTTTSTVAGTSRKAPNYKELQTSLDVNKAKRLITARESSIKSVKNALKRETDNAG